MSIELNTGAPRERAELTIDPSGTVELVLGTMSAGQGHEASFAQVTSPNGSGSSLSGSGW
jgi:carbon-monoxide dehydrogenase large subunit